MKEWELHVEVFFVRRNQSVINIHVHINPCSIKKIPLIKYALDKFYMIDKVCDEVIIHEAG